LHARYSAHFLYFFPLFAMGAKLGAMKENRPQQLPPEFVDEFTASAYLGQDVRTLRKWRCSGKGPPFARFGGSIRYSVRVLKGWAGERLVQSTAEADAKERARREAEAREAGLPLPPIDRPRRGRPRKEALAEEPADAE
jgi:hypothetical protein